MDLDRRHLLMGEVLYLPDGATDGGLDFAAFARAGVKHSERSGPPETPLGDCTDYRCFWSLNFAMRRSEFLALGGFDEGYVGYGGEDTDFGRIAAEAGLPFHWTRGARAYHQYHPHHMPPVHHLDSVIANAHRFRDKWGHVTMDHWLKAFTLMGLVERRGDDFVRVRETEDGDLALTAQQSDQPYASSARVLAQARSRKTGAGRRISLGVAPGHRRGGEMPFDPGARDRRDRSASPRGSRPAARRRPRRPRPRRRRLRGIAPRPSAATGTPQAMASTRVRPNGSSHIGVAISTDASLTALVSAAPDRWPR